MLVNMKEMLKDAELHNYAIGSLNTPNLERLEKGLPNLGRHIENIKDKFGLPCVVALNSFPTDSEEEVKAVFDYCRKMGVECSLSEVFAKGGKGGTDLANKVLQAMDDSAKINYAYAEDLTVDKKIEAICKNIYGAKDVIFAKSAANMLKTLTAAGYDKLPVCIAKTQYSFSDDAKLLAAPKDFTMTVRELRLSAGAGFVVAVMGDIMTMPGLPKVPAAMAIDVDENGVIKNLF